MSTIEPSTQGMVVPKQIGKRVMEIMEEKGKAFTQQALATRIGMGRQSLSLKLRGERDLYMFELRRIADALHLPLERIMQVDTYDDEKKLSGMFASLLENKSTTKNPPDFDEMLVIAQRLSDYAVGMTERCKTLNDLGRAYFLLHRYAEAHDTWLKSLHHAKQIADKNNDYENYHLVLSNLLLSISSIQNHPSEYKLLNEIENAFSTNPHRLGVVYYVRSKKSEYEGNMEEAKTHAKRSLDCFLQTGNSLSIGKAEVTVAHFEFITENYFNAKKYLEEAIGNLTPYMYEWLISIKEYAKTLLKLQKEQEMVEIVENALIKADPVSSKFRDIVGKLHLLLSISKNETSYAESVLFDNRINVNVRTLAYKYLRQYCIQNGDEKTLMKYAIMEQELDIAKNDLLDEEMF